MKMKLMVVSKMKLTAKLKMKMMVMGLVLGPALKDTGRN